MEYRVHGELMKVKLAVRDPLLEDFGPALFECIYHGTEHLRKLSKRTNLLVNFHHKLAVLALR